MIDVFVPQDTTALALGSDGIASLLTQLSKSRGLDLNLTRNGSRGMFWLEPLLEVDLEGIRVGFGPMTLSDVPSVLIALESNTNEVSDINHPLFLGPVENIEYFRTAGRISR